MRRQVRLYQTVFPDRIDNSYPGKRSGLWLFCVILLMKSAMSLNSMLFSYSIAVSADGIPLGSYPEAASQAIVALFSLLGLSSMILCLLGFLALARYRSMVPLMFLLMILQYAGTRGLLFFHPIVRAGHPAGGYFNIGLFALTLVGLGLSLGGPHQVQGQPDYELAKRVARLWPHREHESNGVLGLLCRIGLHRWRRLDLKELMPGRDILECFWCSSIKIDGITYDL